MTNRTMARTLAGKQPRKGAGWKVRCSQTKVFSEMGTRSASDCGYFQILEYLHILHGVSREEDPNLT